jgi:hypothetical protein
MTSPHRYLMDEYPHSFYPTLAECIGLNEAIVLLIPREGIRNEKCVMFYSGTQEST